MKNPMMLRMKDKIVNVSTLIQGMRWDRAVGRYLGCVIWISTP